MKQNQFIRIVAECFCVEEKTLTVYLRRLREAGLLTSGARGVNAPPMLPIDAARTTIALLSTDMPSRAVERVGRFSSIPYSVEQSDNALPGFLQNISPLNVETALTAMFTPTGYERLEVNYVEFHENARKVRIVHRNGVIWFREAARTEDQKITDARELFGIRRIRGLSGAELNPLQVLINNDIPAELDHVSASMIAQGILLASYAMPSPGAGFDESGLPLDPDHAWNSEGGND